MLIISIIMALLTGLFLITMGPVYAFAFIVFFLAGYAFLFHFRKMFVFFIIARPIFDIFGRYGIRVGYSNVNIAACLSILFVIGGLFYLIINKKSIFVYKEINVFILFLLFAILSTIFNIGLVGFQGVFAWIRLVVVLVVMLVIAHDYKDARSLIRLMKYILFSACIPVIFAVIQMFTKISMSSGQGFERINGGFAHSNVFATYLTVFIIMLFCMLSLHNTIVTKRLKLYLWGLTAIMAVCMFLTYARGAWIALAVSLSLLGLLYFRKKLFYGVTLIIFILLAGYFLTGRILILDEVMRRFDDVRPLAQTQMLRASQSSFSWRLLYWKELLFKLKDSPIIGYGLGSVVILGSYHMEAHNNYLHVFFETGIGGLFFYFAMIFMFLGRAYKGIHHQNSNVRAFAIGVFGVFISYLINSISGHLIRNAVYQMYFLSLPIILIGLMEVSFGEKKISENENRDKL